MLGRLPLDGDPQRDNHNLAYVVMMAAMGIGEIAFYVTLLVYATTDWNNYFFVWFYTPVCIVRGVCYVFALGAYNKEWHKLRVGYFNFFAPKYYNWLSRWYQSAGWTFLLFMLLNIRAIWLVSQVRGWGDSPCDKSSCTRSDSLDLMYAVPFAVYNPRGPSTCCRTLAALHCSFAHCCYLLIMTGWFPHGDKERYDELGATRYVFCNFEEHCRWADFNGKAIKSYEKLAGGCELNTDEPVPYEKGFASRDHDDYPNPGKGILNGWSPCKLVGQSYPCRGNRQQNTLALANSTSALIYHHDGRPASEVVVSDSVIHGKSYLKYFKGKRVCSTCALYQNTVLSFFGENDPGHVQFKDEDTECVPNVDGSVNPWCFICPGEGGAFGGGNSIESVNPHHLEGAMEGFIGFACYILGTTVIMTFFFVWKRHRIILKRIPDRYAVNDRENNQDKVLEGRHFRKMLNPVGPVQITGAANRALLNAHGGIHYGRVNSHIPKEISHVVRIPSFRRKGQ